VGLLLEYVAFQQTFDTMRIAPARAASGASFAGLVGLELPLGAGFGLRVEGGPVGSVFPVESGQGAVSVRGAVTGFFSGGLTWRR